MVYPNPFSDHVTLVNTSNEKLEIIVYDLLGKELMRHYVPVGETILDFSGIRDNALIVKAVYRNKIKTKKLLRLK